jgi:hypothetical protein
MAAVLFRLTSTPVFDTNGNPVSGALANWYLSGTLTRTPIYTDSGLSIEHENPVEANASGVLPSIYLDSDIAYRVIITDADGAELSDTDPYEDLDGAAVLAKLLTVDGSGSGLDADKLRGTTPTTFGLSLIDDAAASNARTTLGLGSMATQSSSNVTITGGSISVPLTINATAIAYQFVLEDAGTLVRHRGVPGRHDHLSRAAGLRRFDDPDPGCRGDAPVWRLCRHRDALLWRLGNAHQGQQQHLDRVRQRHCLGFDAIDVGLSRPSIAIAEAPDRMDYLEDVDRGEDGRHYCGPGQ